MSIPTIFVVSATEMTSKVLSKKLEALRSEALGGIRFINLEIDKLSHRIDDRASLVILNLPPWRSEHLLCVQMIRDKKFHGPILLLIDDLDHWTKTLAENPNLKRLKLLARPFEDAQLVGYVRRLLAQETIHYREFPRYEMNQRVELVDDSKATFPCQLRNVSKGGACVAFQGEPPVNQNEFITLNVALNFALNVGNENHKVRSRVVWVQKSNALCGLEFVDQVD